jgi:NAD(P) transhydrogenase subunit beta
MNETLVNVAYMIACVFFIVGIKKLTKPQTAKQGNMLSAVGMLIAVIAVFFEKNVVEASREATSWWQNGYLWMALGLLIGSVIGIVWAKKIKMTKMPELVALLNGIGALASAFIGFTEFLGDNTGGNPVNAASIGIAVFIGASAFTGSMLAWGKLSEKITGKAIVFKGSAIINLVLVLVAATAITLFAIPAVSTQIKVIAVVTLAAVSLIFGITLVLPIGGGDMPVIISLMNSLTGIAVAMVGFILGNTVLIVTGCLVGTSGVILTLIMCKAMNRSIGNILFSGFGASGSQGGKAGGPAGEPKSISAEDAYLILEAAQSVVFIPGYGMAVAQAQHVVKELADKLAGNGAEVSFAVHPVAGRMPGHMNVLLAEADIPYEQLKTMEEINPTMPTQDVAIVIGANDVVNPAAETDTSSPIYGMPIIKAHGAKTVFVLKRGKGKGFSGIENELFLKPNTLMIYGDAKATISSLVKEFQSE